MRLAILSDVHGNLPALEAALRVLRAGRLDAIWFAGDYVGYGPWPEECVQEIIAMNAPAIYGNYDLKTLKYPRKAAAWAHSKDPRKLKAFQHAYKGLSAASRAFLGGLPEAHRAEIAGVRLLMTHSAPDSARYGIGPETPVSRLVSIAAQCAAEIVLTGHTHYPCIRTAEGVTFVNAGSVGRPGDGDPRASYAMVEIGGAATRAWIERVEYPVEIVAAETLRTPLLSPEFANLYRKGWSSL